MKEIFEKSKLLDLITRLGIEYENAKARIINNDAKCFVDNYHDISSFVIIDDSWVIPYNISAENFVNFLKNRNIKYIGFCGIPEKDHNIYKEIGIVKWHQPCYLYEKISMAENLNNLIPDGYYIDSLKKYDAHIINNFYTYKDKDSIDEIVKDITMRPSSVIRKSDGTPLSWVLIHSDNSLGIMYTKEEYRTMNFGKIVSSDLINKSLAEGYKPYIHIITDNEKSIKLASAVGFKRIMKVDWIGYELS